MASSPNDLVTAPTSPAPKQGNRNSAPNSQSPKSSRKTPKPPLNPQKKALQQVVLLVLILTGGFGYWLHGYYVTTTEKQQLAALTERQANDGTQYINEFLLQLQQDINAFANRKGLADALANQDSERLQQYRESLQTSRSDLLHVHFAPAANIPLDRNAQYPIRFAEQDLLRRAANGDEPAPEAYKFDDEWRLHVAARIPANTDQPALATALISLNLQQLEQQLNQVNASLGRYLLIQKFNSGRDQTLLSHGAGSLSNTAEKTINNSHWQLRFIPSAAALSSVQVSMPLFIGMVLGFFVVLLAIAITAVKKLIPTKVTPKGGQIPPLSSGPREGGTDDDDSNHSQDITNPIYHNTQHILDVQVKQEDEDLLGLDVGEDLFSGDDSLHIDDTSASDSSQNALAVPDVIFRSYDIRGTVDDQLTPPLAYAIGQALASEALDAGETTLIVARDGRTHSPQLCQQLIAGIRACGCHVLDIGIVPTPLMYFATHELEASNSGVMVTASHNPAHYNGFKMVIDGATLADEDIKALRTRILDQRFYPATEQGELSEYNIVNDYIDRIASDVALAADVSVVIDAGNGATSEVAPLLFEELTCNVTPLYCEFDGTFPNHQPDPSKAENLVALIDKVKEVGADLGIAFDGDGDRVVLVTASGDIVWPDKLLMLLAKDIISINPGSDILFDVKCTRQLSKVITSYGGRPIMWKTGHSHMKAKMIETGAILGGEFSGHIFIKDRWYGFDDGMYAAARLLEVMTLRDQDLDSILATLPNTIATPELLIPVADEEKFDLIDKLVQHGDFGQGEFITIDGLRVDFGKGWGLVRASNTSPALTLRFEGDNQAAIDKMQALFKRELLKVKPSLAIQF